MSSVRANSSMMTAMRMCMNMCMMMRARFAQPLLSES